MKKIGDDFMVKFLRGFALLILSFLLVNCISGIMLSITMEQIIQKDLITSLFAQTAVPQIASSIGLDDKESEAIQEMMEDEKISDTINQISSELMEALGDPNASFDQSTLDGFLDYFIENKDKLEELTGSEIDVEEIEKFKESDEYKEFGEELSESLKKSTAEMDSSSKSALQGYNVIKSNNFRFGLLGAAVVLLILIALVQWSFYKWLGTLGKALFTSGLCITIIGLGVNYFMDYLTQKIDFNIHINTGNILFMGIMSVIVGLLLVVICKIIKNMIQIKKNKEVEVNAIS